MVECESATKNNQSETNTRFNRYMVECECIYSKGFSKAVYVLIDTWWNVNILDQSRATVTIMF